MKIIRTLNGGLFGQAVYSRSICNAYRFFLGEAGAKTLVCIGVNPSTATIDQFDNTISKVSKFSTRFGFDGWVMANLYPQRATNPNEMDQHCDMESVRANVAEVVHLFTTLKEISILCCWGNLIEKRSYLPLALAMLAEALPSTEIYQLGSPTLAGHPRHPLMLSYSEKLETFDLEKYISRWHS